MKVTIKQREHYAFFLPIQTRWADNDLYGHVNNVTYYSYFDTAANALLIQEAAFDPKYSPMIGLVVSSNCQFNQELSYPEIIEVGVAIESMGNSSLSYDLAILNAIRIQLQLRVILFMYLSIVRHEKAPRFQPKCGMPYLDLLCLKIQSISAEYFAIHHRTAATGHVPQVQPVTALQRV